MSVRNILAVWTLFWWLCSGFNIFKLTTMLQPQVKKPFQMPSSSLKFITLDDVPLVEVATSTGVDDSIYMISEAQQSELHDIVSLRVSVFYPDLHDIRSFHAQVLDKLKSRREQGSILLAVTKAPLSTPSPNWNQYTSNIVGTVEFSSIDFKHSSLEARATRENKLYLMDLAVRNDARKKGIASSLLLAAEKYALQHGYIEILLHVEVGNHRALKLYEKHGYEVYPATPNSIDFTESRLYKASTCYIFLWKKVSPR